MIDIKVIEAMESRKRQTLKDTYAKIYEQMERKLQQAVNMRQKQVFLRVPTYVVGYPPFDLEAAQRYLARQFARGGFDVQRVGTLDIYVSWASAAASARSKKMKASGAPTLADDDFEFPSLVNLKKAASQWK